MLQYPPNETNTSRRYCAERMADAVEEVHRPGPKQCDKYYREYYIYEPQTLGRLADSRTYLIMCNTGHLGVEHLHAARVVQHRYYCQSKRV